MNVVPMKTAGILILAVTLLGGVERAAAGVIISPSVPDSQTGCFSINDPASSATGASVYFCVDPIVPDAGDVFFERGAGTSNSKQFSDLLIVLPHGPTPSEAVSVDEPGTLSLMGLGLFAVGLLNRRRRDRAT